MTEEEFFQPLKLGEQELLPGDRETIQLPIGHLITHEMIQLTVHVRRGMTPGPRLLVTAALHGDEINGVEVVRRLLRTRMNKLAGDLLLIPITNMPAFLSRSRYLPDRRDLNRLFPGSKTGSFGARLANVITEEVARSCTHGIDLHCGAVYRPNLPQIRYTGEVSQAFDMANAFGTPVMIDSSIRDGTLRYVFSKQKKPQIVYESGEAQILDPASVRLGITGVLSVMRHLKMLPMPRTTTPRPDPVVCRRTWWQRAPRGGLFLPSVDLGAIVTKGKILGKIGDPFSIKKTNIRSERDGVIIGRARNAVIDEGDGLFHIGLTDSPDVVQDNIEAAEAEMDHAIDHPVFDDPMTD